MTTPKKKKAEPFGGRLRQGAGRNGIWGLLSFAYISIYRLPEKSNGGAK